MQQMSLRHKLGSKAVRPYMHLPSPSLWLLLLLCLSCVWQSKYALAADDVFVGTLSRQERTWLEQTACRTPYGVAAASIEGQAFTPHAQARFAEIKCRPHTYLQQHPLYYVSQCAREGQRWSCNQAELETRLILTGQPNKRELLIRPGAVSADVALSALQKVSRYGYFQGQSVDAALQSTCHIGLGEKPDLLEISCARWSLTISFWCPATPQQAACPRIIWMARHAD